MGSGTVGRGGLCTISETRPRNTDAPGGLPEVTMSEHQLHLLSPYRLPTSYPLQLTTDEVAAWLNGYASLWHPAALAGAAGPPLPANTYDHDTPGPGNVYGIPQGPTLYQPDDWPNRVVEANAVTFPATADRAETFGNLLDALREKDRVGPLIDLPEEAVRPFAGLGLGFLLVEGLFDAMDHDHLLDVPAFWTDVQAAVAAVARPDGGEDVRTHLKAAAETLRYAREQLYSGAFYWLDWCIPDLLNLAAEWPASLAAGLPLTLLCSAELLERMAHEAPDRFAELREKMPADLPSHVDLCCGAYREREDALFPLESQWWNLRKAREVSRELLGSEPATYGRTKSAYHPQLPAWLQQMGYRHAVLVSFDGALMPSLRGTAVNWPAPDGKAVDAFTREPLPAHDPHTFFNLVYHLHQSTSQDAAPTVALAHKGRPPADPYRDLLALADLAPVFGEWVGLGRYFADALSGEYIGPQQADDFFADYLDDRVTKEHRPDPVSGFPRHARLRRRIDSAYALAALYRSLTAGPPSPDESATLQKLAAVEDEVEVRGVNVGPADAPDPLAARLTVLEADVAKRLADRVQVGSPDGRPGLLVFNPCSFTRRAALELDGFRGPIPVDGPVKAAEFGGDKAKLVVEVPPLGFAWVPRVGPAGTPHPKPRIKLAEGTTVRNEFFEAEIDPTTGGLRAFRDLRSRTNRFGQQLVFNPGSKLRVTSVAVTNSGAALGEITTEGTIVDDHGEPLAGFRQRFRAWLGRPVLEVRIELDVTHKPTGYPWHAYYAARFGWRDERAVLFRGVNGANTLTGYTRPVSPDYLEVRLGSERSFLFTGGLPFVQRHGGRMADVVLVPEGETAGTFDLLLATDRDQPMQTAMGWVSPTPVVVTDKGPPSVGPASWLAHVDMPSLVLTSLRPAEAASGRAVVAQFAECAGFGGAAEVRFARNPSRALTVDGMDRPGSDLTLIGDAVSVDYSAGETVRMRVEWE